MAASIRILGTDFMVFSFYYAETQRGTSVSNKYCRSRQVARQLPRHRHDTPDRAERRIVHTVRNPIDTCVSCYSRLFASGQPGAMLDVSYEDVVDDLEGQAIAASASTEPSGPSQFAPALAQV
jgi:hypothetical protein